MVDPVREGAALLLLAVGVFFYLSGAVGIVRFPDVYNRIHASTKTSTLGLVSILLSGLVAIGVDPVTLKALAIVVFVALTFPVAGHLLARAAYRTGVVLSDKTLHDEYKHVLELGEGEEGSAVGAGAPQESGSGPSSGSARTAYGPAKR